MTIYKYCHNILGPSDTPHEHTATSASLSRTYEHPAFKNSISNIISGTVAPD